MQRSCKLQGVRHFYVTYPKYFFVTEPLKTQSFLLFSDPSLFRLYCDKADDCNCEHHKEDADRCFVARFGGGNEGLFVNVNVRKNLNIKYTFQNSLKIDFCFPKKRVFRFLDLTPWLYELKSKNIYI